MTSVQKPVPAYVLPLLVLSQFAGTSLWFAGNAILPGIQQQFHFPDTFLGSITIAVQVGFITGTLAFSMLLIADRFSAVKLFMLSALVAALFNLLIILTNGSSNLLLLLRFLTGFFLAGVYPVGMKIAADWFAQRLGKALGFLVGALVAGTAFPYWLRSSSYHLPWQQVMICTSLFAAAGGLLIGFGLKNGPHRTRNAAFSWKVFGEMFKAKDFRAYAFGYFGHMWELYTIWAFIPVLIAWYNQQHGTAFNPAWWSFLVIAAGSVSCMTGGIIAQKTSGKLVAFIALTGSGICCLLSPLLLQSSPCIFLAGLLVWGILLTADSPQFSALVAQTVHATHKGTALTLVTSIGFAITVASIQLLNYLWLGDHAPLDKKYLLLVLGIGPAFGIWSMRQVIKRNIK